MSASERAGASGMILAGGRSSRMGFDKLDADLDGASLLLRVSTALAPLCREVLVVGGPPQSAPPGALHVRDEPGPYGGPLVGLASGLERAACPIVLALAGDLPFVSGALLRELRRRVEEGALAAVPVHPAPDRMGGRRNLHPLCAAYRTEAALRCARAALDAGERSVRALISRLERSGRVEYLESGLERFGDPDVYLMNVNTPEDLRRARRLAAR